MTLDEMAKQDWQTLRAAFETFVKGRAAERDWQIRVNFGAMDQESVEAEIGQVGARLVRDRGSVFLEVRVADQWHSSRNLLGLLDGIDPRLLALSPEPGPAFVLARWDAMIGAVSNATSDALADHEAAIGHAFMARLTGDDQDLRATPLQVDPRRASAAQEDAESRQESLFEKMLALSRSRGASAAESTKVAGPTKRRADSSS